jgi:hypothetical protein
MGAAAKITVASGNDRTDDGDWIARLCSCGQYWPKRFRGQAPDCHTGAQPGRFQDMKGTADGIKKER